MPYPHPIIAREGWPFVAGSLLAAIVVHVWAGFWWALPLWIVALFILQFFRDPPRTPPADPNAVVSPADGRIVVVERARDPYLDRDAIKLSVFMNVFNAHSNRIPYEGDVRKKWYHAGSFLNASLSKASLENERAAIWLATDRGDITVVQVAGLIARRIICHAKEGQHLKRGDRFGFIRFGSRVDVYLPLTAVPKASVGDKVYATSTTLAVLP
ncbi:MAG TPA: phosphatidylserine decarboxylase [Burkholderiales bacterium]|nr:phosphatidylserine decarboxylase [Burkholderiales bacterium]